MLGWLFGFLWLAALKAWLGSHLALDSDALGVADLWRSLASGGHLGAWTMGPHPYVFPDLPLYGLGTLFFGGIPGRQLGFGLVQGFLLWWFLARLMRRLGPGLDGSLARAYAASGLILLLPFLNADNGLGQALVPGYHGGALLVGLALLAWAARQDARPSPFPGVVWAAFWVGLTWASDQLTPALAVAPALMFSLGLGGQARRRVWGASALAWLFRAGTLALWRALGLRVARFQWAFLWAHAAQQWGGFADGLPAFLSAAAWPLALSLLAVGLWWSARREHPREAWLGAAALVSAVLGTLVAVAEGAPEGRYVLGWVWLGLPWLPLLAARLLGGRPLPLLAAALLGLFCLDLAPARVARQPEAIQSRWLDAQAGARGLTRGLAGYSLARPLRLLSQTRLTLLPVQTGSGVLEPDPWFEDRSLFQTRPQVQFVVLNGLDPNSVRKALGPPVEAAQGTGLRVWFYAKP